MEKLSVDKIIVPADAGIAMEPSVHPDHKISEALEIMLKNDMKQIAVVKGKELLGMIRLVDALNRVGLDRTLKPKKTPSVVVHGRKITVDS